MRKLKNQNRNYHARKGVYPYCENAKMLQRGTHPNFDSVPTGIRIRDKDSKNREGEKD